MNKKNLSTNKKTLAIEKIFGEEEKNSRRRREFFAYVRKITINSLSIIKLQTKNLSTCEKRQIVWKPRGYWDCAILHTK